MYGKCCNEILWERGGKEVGKKWERDGKDELNGLKCTIQSETVKSGARREPVGGSSRLNKGICDGVENGRGEMEGL